MNNFQQSYKKKPLGFTNTNDGRLVRAVKHEERRKLHRAANFSRHRDVPEAPEIEEPSPRPTETAAKLRRWKAERDIRKKIEALKKRPAFKVGAVHHKFYSPPASNKAVVKDKPCHTRGAYKVKHQPTPEKRITRATQKRLDAKLAGAAKTPVKTPKVRQRAKRGKLKPARKKSRSMTREPKFSFAPENHEFKAPAGLPEIPLFGRFFIPKDMDVGLPWHEKSSPDEKEKPRQTMEKMLSLVSPDAPSGGDSSNESSAQKLSSENANPEARNFTMSVDAEKELDSPDSEIRDVVKFAESDTTTPPRSGSPVPASFSPYIVSSRGKGSARKEQKTKLGIRESSPEEIPTKDTVMKKLNISVEEEERTAQYFKFILEREVERLTEICEKWEATMNEPDLTEDARYLINQAVGQTRLLIRKKFERFRRLVLDCETGKGEMLVQCRDLQGFWDMMYMEVKDCETRFLKLDFLRSKGWVEEPQIAVAPTRRAKKTTKAIAAKPKIGAKSSARSWILAARKNKISLADDDAGHFRIADENVETEASQGENALTSSPAKNSRQSRRKTPTTPKGQNRRRTTPNSLLKQVQVAEASKTVKTPEVKLDDSITYVNSDQTPSKGILKKSDDSAGHKSNSPKAGRKVDFNHVYLEEFPVEDNGELEALQNSIDLGRALARIDAYGNDDDDMADEISGEDVDNEALQNSIDLGRALARIDAYDDDVDNFAAEVSDEDADNEALQNSIDLGRALARIDNYDADDREGATSDLTETFASMTFSTSSSQTVKRFTSELVEASFEENKADESLVGVRILRSRTVATDAWTTTGRRSVKRQSTFVEQYSSVNSSVKENNDPRRGWKKEASGRPTSGTSEEPANRRRSTRRISISFSQTHLTPNKFSNTTHSRRSRKISLLGTNSRESVLPPPINGDLMSFDTPK